MTVVSSPLYMSLDHNVYTVTCELSKKKGDLTVYYLLPPEHKLTIVNFRPSQIDSQSVNQSMWSYFVSFLRHKVALFGHCGRKNNYAPLTCVLRMEKVCYSTLYFIVVGRALYNKVYQCFCICTLCMHT